MHIVDRRTPWRARQVVKNDHAGLPRIDQSSNLSSIRVQDAEGSVVVTMPRPPRVQILERPVLLPR